MSINSLLLFFEISINRRDSSRGLQKCNKHTWVRYDLFPRGIFHLFFFGKEKKKRNESSRRVRHGAHKANSNFRHLWPCALAAGRRKGFQLVWYLMCMCVHVSSVLYIYNVNVISYNILPRGAEGNNIVSIYPCTVYSYTIRHVKVYMDFSCLFYYSKERNQE